eukprot:300935_1
MDSEEMENKQNDNYGMHRIERKLSDELFGAHQTSTIDDNSTLRSQTRNKKSLRMTMDSEEMENKQNDNYGMHRIERKLSDELFGAHQTSTLDGNSTLRSQIRNKKSLRMTSGTQEMEQENDNYRVQEIKKTLSDELFSVTGNQINT